MARGNGMGPMEAGPMTGRRAGYCAGFGIPGFANPGTVAGRGMGMGYGRGMAMRYGRGMGMGRRQMYAPSVPVNQDLTVSPEQEKNYLSNEKDYLAQELKNIEKRLQELESE